MALFPTISTDVWPALPGAREPLASQKDPDKMGTIDCFDGTTMRSSECWICRLKCIMSNPSKESNLASETP